MRRRHSKRPHVSIVIPAYNREGFIKTCLDSVTAQTYKEYEVILVDDASTDSTGRIMRRYRSRADMPAVYIRNATNAGPAGSRNAAIKKARGRYIAFLDSDDTWAPVYLAEQVRSIKRPGCLLSYSDFNVITADGDIMIKSYIKNVFQGGRYDNKMNYLPSTSSMIFDKEVFADIGTFDAHFRHLGDDMDMFKRFMGRYGRKKARFIKLPLVSVRFHGGQEISPLRRKREGRIGRILTDLLRDSRHKDRQRREALLLDYVYLDYKKKKGYWNDAR